ncbi:hypothetical protein PISL3812_04726 [Talaromyces islandicus]|uniref:Thioredoxin-like fold domain-containing protein n=1 Tax=Talaromyces islandicus TaxID=28573 RepID=A0A0U1LXZ2_TALIS|nr:hypothetical protein PISL3812_04726 [Talaromyces islandicus]
MSTSTLVVYRGFPERGAYVWSPFVTKLEARLRFARVSYQIETGSPRQAPRGKIPYISLSHADAAEPVMLADSQLISDTLTDEGILPRLNEALSPVERALDASVRALIEDKLAFLNTHERWNENYYTMRDKILAAIPYPARMVVGMIVWRKINASLYGQGTGRFSPEEIRASREKVWHHIEDLLADARCKAGVSSDRVFWIFGGSEPTDADTAVFGFIIGGLVCGAAPESGKLIRSLPSVIAYARRIHDEYFPDYTSPEWE